MKLSNLGKRRLVFVEEVGEHEPKQEAFLKKVGDYQTGRFWNKFRTIDDLRNKIEVPLKEVFVSLMKGLSESQLKERLQKEVLEPLYNDYSQSWLITAAMPDCQASLTDDASFNDDKFAKQVFLMGQEGDPPVFEIELAKSKNLKEDHWVLDQTENQRWGEGQRLSIVKLYLDGCAVVAMNVTERESSPDRFSFQGYYIYPDTFQEIADAQLSFLARIYNYFDPHFRWDHIALMSALHNVGHRIFGRPKTSNPMLSVSLPFGSSEKAVLAFDRPKIIERNQLDRPDYGQAIKAAFERKLRKSL